MIIGSRAFPDCLLRLIDDGVIEAAVSTLKSGKEADLFIVEDGGQEYVAKVYKERKIRNFKNDAGYREGRGQRRSRDRRAIQKNSRYGQEVSEEAWHQAEVDALRRLGACGARVPQVYAHHERVLIMEMVRDAGGEIAPQLAQVELDAAGARAMYETILEQVILMLLNDLVHGDLSPYNVLVGAEGPVIIDMPQCVSAAHNLQAGRFLERDVMAVARHLGLIDPEILELGRGAWQIWAEYERGVLSRGFRPEPGKVRGADLADLDGLLDYVRESQEEGELERRAASGDVDAWIQLNAQDKDAEVDAPRPEAPPPRPSKRRRKRRNRKPAKDAGAQSDKPGAEPAPRESRPAASTPRASAEPKPRAPAEPKPRASAEPTPRAPAEPKPAAGKPRSGKPAGKSSRPKRPSRRRPAAAPPPSPSVPRSSEPPRSPLKSVPMPSFGSPPGSEAAKRRRRRRRGKPSSS